MNKSMFESAFDEIRASNEFKINTVKIMKNSMNNLSNKNLSHRLKYRVPLVTCLLIIACAFTFIFLNHRKENVYQYGNKNTDSTVCMQEINGDLYFNKPKSGLYVYNKDHGAVTNLNTSDILSLTSFDKKIFYISSDYILYKYDTDTRSQNAVYSFINNSTTPRVYYADNKYVYAVSGNPEHIYKISIYGGKATEIPVNIRGTVNDLKLIQNEIYYSLSSNDNGGIYRISLSGKTTKLCSFICPRNFFKYKNKLVFTADKDLTITNVYVMDIDGSNIKQITASPLIANFLAMSNDSVYFETKNGICEYNMDNATSKKVNIDKATYIYGVETGLYCYYPAHSGHLWYYDFNRKKTISIF